MTIGDPANYATAITINVERFPCIMVAKPPAASNFTVKRENDTATDRNALLNGDNLAEHDDTLSKVYNAINYKVKDEDAPGGKRDVSRDELSRGYTYGRTAVHIDDSEATLTNLDTVSSLDVLGFVLKDKVSAFFGHA